MFLNHSQLGDGEFEFYRVNHNSVPKKLLDIDANGNITITGNITCNAINTITSTVTTNYNSLSINGSLSCGSITGIVNITDTTQTSF